MSENEEKKNTFTFSHLLLISSIVFDTYLLPFARKENLKGMVFFVVHEKMRVTQTNDSFRLFLILTRLLLMLCITYSCYQIWDGICDVSSNLTQIRFDPSSNKKITQNRIVAVASRSSKMPTDTRL